MKRGEKRWRTLVPEFQNLLSNNTNRPICQFSTGNLRSPCLLPSHQITFCSVTESSGNSQVKYLTEDASWLDTCSCSVTFSIAEDKAKHWGNSCSQKKTNGLPEIYAHFCSPQYFPKYMTQKWCFMKREEGEEVGIVSTQKWQVCIWNPL